MADTEALVNQLGECAEKQDFEGAFRLVRENQVELSKKMRPELVGEALKKTTGDRLLLSFIDGVEFGSRPLDETLFRLEKLLSFRLESLVLNSTWGIGKVKKVDAFYRRITVDFKTKRGHQFTYAAAVDMLVSAPEDHILVMREADPVAFERLVKETPGDFVKAVIRSNGSSMTLIRLEDYCVANGLVKSVNWKSFWEKARTDLRRDKCVAIPAKKTEPIRLMATVEDYGTPWLTAFAHETDPKLILASVREFVAQDKFKSADESVRASIGETILRPAMNSWWNLSIGCSVLKTSKFFASDGRLFCRKTPSIVSSFFSALAVSKLTSSSVSWRLEPAINSRVSGSTKRRSSSELES